MPLFGIALAPIIKAAIAAAISQIVQKVIQKLLDTILKSGSDISNPQTQQQIQDQVLSDMKNASPGERLEMIKALETLAKSDDVTPEQAKFLQSLADNLQTEYGITQDQVDAAPLSQQQVDELQDMLKDAKLRTNNVTIPQPVSQPM